MTVEKPSSLRVCHVRRLFEKSALPVRHPRQDRDRHRRHRRVRRAGGEGARRRRRQRRALRQQCRRTEESRDRLRTARRQSRDGGQAAELGGELRGDCRCGGQDIRPRRYPRGRVRTEQGVEDSRPDGGGVSRRHGGQRDAVLADGRQMLKQGQGGKVILMSSARGLLGHPAGYTAYCASKSAVDGITKALGCEWGDSGITVNALGPTVFRSPLTQWMFEDTDRSRGVRKGFLTRVPKGRLGEPSDLAGPLLFLASKASDFYTGHILYADGGYTAG